jgi:hypothetical protein
MAYPQNPEIKMRCSAVYFGSVDLFWIGISALLHKSPVLVTDRAGYALALGRKLQLMMAAPYLVLSLVRLHLPERVNVPDGIFCQQ